MSGSVALVAMVYMLMVAGVHIAFAVAIGDDAGRVPRTMLVGPGTWSFATLVGGVRGRPVLGDAPLDAGTQR